MSKVLNIQFFMLGVGILITWSSFIATLDWLNLQFPDRKVNFVFPLVWFLPSLIFQSLTIWKGSLISFNTRIITSFLVGCVFFLLAFICAAQIRGTTGFYLMLLGILIFASFNSVAEASIYGLTSILSQDYTNSYITGICTSGFIIASLRLICLATFANDDSDLLTSTAIYYTMSSCLLILCSFVQASIMRNVEVIEKLTKTKSSPPQENVFEIEEKTCSLNNSSFASAKFTDILSRIWSDLLLMGVSFTFTMAFFPGVALATSDSDIPYSWLNTILVLTLNSGDIVGSLLPKIYIMNDRSLVAMTFIRLVFCYLLVVIARNEPPAWLFDALWFKLVNMFLFSCSCGYTTTCYIIKMTSSLPQSMKEMCGYIVAAAILIFICIGSLIALSFTQIGHIPQS